MPCHQSNHYKLIVVFPFEDVFGVRSRTSGGGSMDQNQIACSDHESQLLPLRVVFF